MSDLTFHLPSDRAVIAISGEDRQAFLQGLVTNDVAKVSGEQSIYAALLTAQGRFLFDMFVMEHEGRYLVDAPGPRRADLIKRLSMYKLRSKVTIADADHEWCVALLFGTDALKALNLEAKAGKAIPYGGGIATVDPRLAKLGARLVLPRNEAHAHLIALGAHEDADGSGYHALRIRLGVPDAALDLTPEKSILLENGFDELNAIDWQKGCYMGQELTARTRYRGLVRKRLLPITVDGPAPAPGTPLLLGDQEAGEIRSIGRDGRTGLAMVRLEALKPGAALRAGDAIIAPTVPDWMRLPEPDEAKA